MEQDAVVAISVGAISAIAGFTAKSTAMVPLVSVIMVVISSDVVVIVIVVMRVDVDPGGGQQHQDDGNGGRSGTNQMADQREHGGHMGHGRFAVKRHRDRSPLRRSPPSPSFSGR